MTPRFLGLGTWRGQHLHPPLEAHGPIRWQQGGSGHPQDCLLGGEGGKGADSDGDGGDEPVEY